MTEDGKIKLLLVGHRAGLGGADRYCYEQAVLLKCIGYDVECIVFEGGPLECDYRQQGISLTVCPIPQLDCHKIGVLIKDYDFVITNTMYALFFAYESQKQKPTLLILHDCPSYMENIFIRTSLACQELRQIRHLYGVSKYHADTLIQSGFKEVRVLNNFAADSCPVEICRGESKKVKFLTVANWNLVKGYDLALEALQQLTLGEKEQLEWHIVGQMENEEECIRFLQRAEKEPWVILHGIISDKNELQRYYIESNIYLHMSREDSCPLAVVDAAMFQMPMIVSKDTGANYLAENGAGWIVDEYDPDSIINAVREALNRKSQLNGMGRTARENYLENATPEKYVQALSKEIKAIIDADSMHFQNADGQLNPDQEAFAKDAMLPRIALYGYNMYAQIEQFYHRKKHLYKLIGIYDRNYEEFRKQGFSVSRPKDLLSEDFDYVCICCVFESTIQAIKKSLMELGVLEEKIRIGVNSVLKNGR